MKARYHVHNYRRCSFCWLLAANAVAHPATGIVVDRAGNVYFSDLETIWKLSTDGKLAVFREGQRGRHIHELAIDDQDNIYGADVSYNPNTKGWPSNVWKMTPNGKSTYLLETTENPPRGISIWRDRDGNMFWVDQNNHTKTQTLLLKRTPAGVVSTLAGSSYGHADGKGNSAKFSSVGGMAIGVDGSIYLSDGAFVRKVAMDGTVTTIGSGLNFREWADQPRFRHGFIGKSYWIECGGGWHDLRCRFGKQKTPQRSGVMEKLKLFCGLNHPSFPTVSLQLMGISTFWKLDLLCRTSRSDRACERLHPTENKQFWRLLVNRQKKTERRR